MYEIVDNEPSGATIKVIGVGGGGGNAVAHMVSSEVSGVEFICANTDAQALQGFEASAVVQLGTQITKGLGAGSQPEIGRLAAQEDRERIADVLQGADMVFVTAGMGGGTGTGAAPVIAQIAKEMGVLTVAVVTTPFPFEGRKRSKLATEGLKELSEHVDSLITIPNEKLLPVLGNKVSLVSAFGTANDVLLGAVQGIADLIMRPGLINVDFADVRTVMSEMGMAMMGTGTAKGDDRARVATDAAIRSPLLEDVNLHEAKGILVNVTAGLDMNLGEYSEVGNTIEEFAADDANVVMGTVIDADMVDELKVTVIVTGLGDDRVKDAPEPVSVPSQELTSARSPSFKSGITPPSFQTADFKQNSGSQTPEKNIYSIHNNKPQDRDFGQNEFDAPAFLKPQAD